jgi:hypothetical protein
MIMYKFRKSLITLIGVVSLMTVVTVVVPHTGYGSNGTAAPAPSTQNVNVVNTPTVNAQQSGTWSVNINGTPVVGLDAANNTVRFDAVNNTVKIDAATPVMVRDIDNPARQPFQASTSIVLPFGQTQGSRSVTTVPAGKVLVIEDISADGRLDGNDKLLSLAIFTGGASYYLHPNDEGIDELGRRVYSASQHVRLYVPAGEAVTGFAERNPATGQPGVNFSVFGYYVDAP